MRQLSRGGDVSPTSACPAWNTLCHFAFESRGHTASSILHRWEWCASETFRGAATQGDRQRSAASVEWSAGTLLIRSIVPTPHHVTGGKALEPSVSGKPQRAGWTGPLRSSGFAIVVGGYRCVQSVHPKFLPGRAGTGAAKLVPYARFTTWGIHVSSPSGG
jgi:hypothetical protein